MPVRPFRIAAALLLATVPLALGARTTAPSATISAAIADPRRPDADRARDADRKPAQTLAFAGVGANMTVFEIMPGGGYFTRLFAGAVGPAGHVYAYIPAEMLRPADALDAKRAALTQGYPNVMVGSDPLLSPVPPAFRGVADIAFIAQNYHDLHDIPDMDVVAFDRLVFQILKPGGSFVVIDHSAPAGTGLADTNTLHRIDAATVRQEAEAAGFRFAGSSPMLANPADTRMLKVFDPAIRGHTDQFMFKFVKPAR